MGVDPRFFWNEQPALALLPPRPTQSTLESPHASLLDHIIPVTSAFVEIQRNVPLVLLVNHHYPRVVVAKAALCVRHDLLVVVKHSHSFTTRSNSIFSPSSTNTNGSMCNPLAHQLDRAKMRISNYNIIYILHSHYSHNE